MLREPLLPRDVSGHTLLAGLWNMSRLGELVRGLYLGLGYEQGFVIN